MSREKLEEVSFIRSVACLSVVMVHSITRVIDLYKHQLSPSKEFVFLAIRLFFTFGTPIFIFLSEFLLAYSYSDGVPEGFIKKRVKYIFFPYISMSFIYGFLMVIEGVPLRSPTVTAYVTFVLRNLLFGFYRHGYFILVIFQFYFIHILFHKNLNEWKAKYVLFASLLINVIYLGFFSFVEPFNIPFGPQLWQGLSWGSFPAWIFYFSLGFYTGKNYRVFKENLKRYTWVVFILPIVTLTLVMYIYAFEIITINSSKRVDMIFFATSMIFLLFYISVHIIKIPKWAHWISRYSFGIYLFHMLYLAIMTGIVFRLDYHFITPVMMLFLMFIGSTMASIYSTFLIGRLPIGPYIVGKLELNKRKF